MAGDDSTHEPHGAPAREHAAEVRLPRATAGREDAGAHHARLSKAESDIAQLASSLARLEAWAKERRSP